MLNRSSFHHVLLATLIILASITLLHARGGSSVRYKVTDLSSPGELQSNAYGINSSGQVVGTSVSNGSQRVFIYDGNTVRYLRTLSGTDIQSNISYPLGINDSGDVVGSSDRFLAFLYRNGGVRILGTLRDDGDGNSAATGINNQGQVVGYAHYSGYLHAFIYQDSMRDLGIPGLMNFAQAINNLGEIVGTYSTTLTNPFSFRPYLRSGNGGFHDLGTLGGGGY